MCEYALETCYSWIHPRIPTYINDNAWQKYDRVPPVDVCRDVPHQKNAVIIFSFFKKKKESLSNHNLHGSESEWRRCGAFRLTKLEGHNYKINIKVNTFFNKGWWGNSRKAGLDQIVSKEQS